MNSHVHIVYYNVNAFKTIDFSLSFLVLFNLVKIVFWYVQICNIGVALIMNRFVSFFTKSKFH